MNYFINWRQNYYGTAATFFSSVFYPIYLFIYLFQEAQPVSSHLDSSSNASSATSSAPSSPHYQQSSPPSVNVTPPPNASPQGCRGQSFNFPGLWTQRNTQDFPYLSSIPGLISLWETAYRHKIRVRETDIEEVGLSIYSMLLLGEYCLSIMSQNHTGV